MHGSARVVDKMFHMVAKQRGFAAELESPAAKAEYLPMVGEHPEGLLVDEWNLLSVVFKKAVDSRRAAGRVIASVELKEKFKGKEQLDFYASEYVAKVEGELQKRDQEIQMVTEAGEVGKVFSRQVGDQCEEVNGQHRVADGQCMKGNN